MEGANGRAAAKSTLETVRKDAYQAALREDWYEMTRCFDGKNSIYVMSPITASKDTALHLAVHSRRIQPLQDLLGIVERNPMLGKPYKIKNVYGNTVLHEAVISGNIVAVKLLLAAVEDQAGEYDKLEQLKTTNVLGETPIYGAASCGRKQIVEYLAYEFRGQIIEEKLLQVHRKRDDLKPILHAAVQGQHFETALTLLKLDPSLHELKDNMGMTCLHLLADMPSAFKSGYDLGKNYFRKFFYHCLTTTLGGGESGDQQRPSEKGWPIIERIRKEKQKHESALKLANELIDKSYWWQSITVESTKVRINPAQRGRGGQSEQQGGAQGDQGGDQGGESNGKERQGAGAQERADLGKGGEREVGKGQGGRQGGVDPRKGGKVKNKKTVPQNPLFIATSNGIVEIATEILEKFPQGIELVNEMGQNILHVAVMHRQREIFRLVKNKNILVDRLSSKIDNHGYTLLHQVAHIKHYRGGTMPGPALQLQQEIKWFKRVQRVVPPYQAAQRDRKNKMTPNDLFEKEHQKQLEMAQNWIEKTSQSCSAVAVLVATVVFAAAYTIPGGSDNNGFPIFLHKRFFLAFTVLDVIALASSLTSVVMFLSILTTSYECEKFYHSIPRRLICGFTLLFFSVMTTMLAFACTLFLVIRLRKEWTTGLISIAAFLPVSVFAVMQFPLYVAFLSTIKDFYKEVLKVLPWIHFPFRCQIRSRTTRRKGY